MKSLSVILLLAFTTQVLSATKHVGVVVKKQGSAEVLASPSKKVQGKGPHVLFEGLYYTLKKIRPGTKIENGNVVKTGKDSKLKIVFKNGDQVNVGEGTAYAVNWKSNSNSKAPEASGIKLLYGSIRGIISKDGPRSGLQVKSKNAVMGVRGTDFYFGQRGSSGKTSISVLRGSVEVKNPKKPKDILQVKQDFSAEFETTAKKESVVSLAKTTKTNLVEIQKESKIDKKDEDKVDSKALRKELVQLEKKAIDTTLKDIKNYQPELYKELKAKNIESIDTVNTIVVGRAFKQAPIKKIKPGFDDLDLKLDEDAYEKYFKVDEAI